MREVVLASMNNDRQHSLRQLTYNILLQVLLSTSNGMNRDEERAHTEY